MASQISGAATRQPRPVLKEKSFSHVQYKDQRNILELLALLELPERHARRRTGAAQFTEEPVVLTAKTETLKMPIPSPNRLSFHVRLCLCVKLMSPSPLIHFAHVRQKSLFCLMRLLSIAPAIPRASWTAWTSHCCTCLRVPSPCQSPQWQRPLVATLVEILPCLSLGQVGGWRLIVPISQPSTSPC